MYKVFPEDTFIRDADRWSKVIPELWNEIDAVVAVMMETGNVPEEYNPHLLDNSNLNYAGYLEFHLLDGKVDLLVIYTKNSKKYTFRLVRLGSHQELFHRELK
ncbi:type II toxin-antitoxin system RelE/ParE family toxin [Lactobacillus sp. PSON]|uniref:type II toxin-antitoxin system RelE/ParE family toxin n=1 Tax=Lactobacillus sp. PSON TaxID=3455454 RepID=UPI004042013B